MAIKIQGNIILNNDGKWQPNYFLPNATNYIGSSSERWENVYSNYGNFAETVTISNDLNVGDYLNVSGDLTVHGKAIIMEDTLTSGALAIMSNAENNYMGMSVPALLFARTATAPGVSIEPLNDSSDDGDPYIVKFNDGVEFSGGDGATPQRLAPNSIYFPVKGLYRFTMQYYMKEWGSSADLDLFGWLKINKTGNAEYTDSSTYGKVLSFRHTDGEVSNWSNDTTQTVSNIVQLDPIADPGDNFTAQKSFLYIDLSNTNGVEHVKVQSVSIELLAPTNSTTYYGG